MRILMLYLDTLRPDHLGCYGYARNTSPNIDRIAAQGMRCKTGRPHHAERLKAPCGATNWK